MRIFQISSVPVGQILDAPAFAERVGGLFLDWDFPVRLLAVSHPFAMHEPIARAEALIRPLERLMRQTRPFLLATQQYLTAFEERSDDNDLTAVVAPPLDGVAHPADVLTTLDQGVRDQLAATVGHVPILLTLLDDPDRASPDAWAMLHDTLKAATWRLAPLYDRREFYATLESRFLRSATYYVLTWEPESYSERQLASALSRAFQRPAIALSELPPLLECDYLRTPGSYLEPSLPGRPWLSVQTMYDMRGRLHLSTLHEILALPIDLAVALDVQTLSRNEARREVGLAYAAARAALNHSKAKDTHSEEKLRDAELTLGRLHTETLHDIWLSILVHGRDKADLQANVAEVRSALGNSCRTTALPTQAEALKLFGMHPLHEVDIPRSEVSRNLLTTGIGYVASLPTYHVRHDTSGLFWGIDTDHFSPLHADLFANNQAAHGAVFGETGSGKTVFLNRLTHEAALDGHRVVWIDAFNNGYRLEQAIGVGCRCHPLSAAYVINPLDVVYDDDERSTRSNWRSKQIPHVIDVLSQLTGKQGHEQGQQVILPYEFSPEEEGILSRVLDTLYANVHPGDPLEQMPTLMDLVALLEERHEREAQTMARRLRMKLTGSEDRDWSDLNEEGRWFVGTTRVDFDLSTDITCYDLFDTPERYRVLYYLWLIGALLRFMRDPKRDVTRKTFLILDEFHMLARVQALMNLAREIVKVARKYGIALILADQNPSTLLASDTGRQIAENMQCLFLFRMKPMGARQMQEVVEGLHDGHVARIADADVGHCTAILSGNIYEMYVPLSPLQHQMFVGS